ncbi:MAG: TatD family hydrolase [Patescibacteria group bacterium]
MNLKFFDAHTHVNLAAFREDYKETITRAFSHGVGMVNVGTQKDTSLRAVEIAREFPGSVYAAIGLHPVHVSKSFHDESELGLGEAAKAFTSRGENFDYDFYKKLASDPKVVAIGECGLDYFRVESSKLEVVRDKQKETFLKQIELSHEVKKPLMIHCRNAPSANSGQAFADLISTLSVMSHKLLVNPGIIHFFSGTKEEAEKLVNLGFSFTFGGVITFARDYDEVIKTIPLDRILSETDAPYVTPEPYRGKRNEPSYVVEVVKKLAEIKGISVDEMADSILANAKKIFSINF